MATSITNSCSVAITHDVCACHGFTIPHTRYIMTLLVCTYLAQPECRRGKKCCLMCPLLGEHAVPCLFRKRSVHTSSLDSSCHMQHGQHPGTVASHHVASGDPEMMCSLRCSSTKRCTHALHTCAAHMHVSGVQKKSFPPLHAHNAEM